jgi:Leucine-rich repeat (LRR) protein
MSSKSLNKALKLIRNAAKTNAVSLDLEGMNLNELPEQLFELSQLESLLLDYNRLTTLSSGS